MRFIFILFTLFSQLNIFAQVIDTSEIKELIKSKYFKALELHKAKDYDKSFDIIKEIYQLSDQIGQFNTKFTVQTLRASALLHDHKYQLLDDHYKVMELHLDKAKPHLQCFYWYNKAQYLAESNRVQEAEYHVEKGLTLLNKSFDDFYILFYGYNKLQSEIESKLKNYRSARVYLNMIEDSLKSTTFNIKNKDEHFYELYNSLGIYSKNIEDYTLAAYYYTKALDYTENQKTTSMVKYNIANVKVQQKEYKIALLMLDSLQDEHMLVSTKVRKEFSKCMIYEALGNRPQYIHSFAKFKNLAKKENFKPLFIHLALLEGIKSYFEENYDLSLKQCIEALKSYEAEKSGFEESIILVKKYLALISAAKDKDLATIQKIGHLLDQKDSLNNKKNSDEVNRLHAEYQTNHNIKENSLLKKEAVLRDEIITAQKTILYGGILAFIGIASLLLILFKQIRVKTRQNQEISAQKEKIQLLNRELNHRVKNNLTFMTSLLDMQGRRSENHEIKEALKESESRLKALALVHGQLFRSESDTEVNLKQYLLEVTKHLQDIFVTKEKPIAFVMEYADYQINAEDAMRLGLIVNELVTNSVKHAFGFVSQPTISIQTEIDTQGKLALRYEDNGPKSASNIEGSPQTESLGLKLIALLKKQLGERYVVMG